MRLQKNVTVAERDMSMFSHREANGAGRVITRTRPFPKATIRHRSLPNSTHLMGGISPSMGISKGISKGIQVNIVKDTEVNMKVATMKAAITRNTVTIMITAITVTDQHA